MVPKLIGQSGVKDTLLSRADTLEQIKDEDTLDEPIFYEAQDSIVAIGEGRKLILYGKAELKYGSMTVRAEIVELDYSRNILTAYGKTDSLGKAYGEPVFKDSEQEITAQKIMYNMKTKRGKIFGALTKQGEMLVYGSEIKKDSNDVVYLKGMKCIPCNEADSRTMFRATKAKIIPDDKIITGPMYLEIGGAPTPLALPFGFFPNAKHSHNGLIIPTYGHSNNWGYFLKDGGYYWGISDKADMVITGDIYSNGSWKLRTMNNYNVLYKGKGNLNLAYSNFLNGDKDIPSTFYKEKASLINWVHSQDNRNNPSVMFSSNVNINFNQYNKYNSENSGQFISNTFMSNINFTKSFKWSSLSLNATHDQNTISRRMNITLPQLTFNVNRFYPFRSSHIKRPEVIDKLGINYLLEGKNTLSGTDSTIFKGALEDSLKYGLQHRLPISTNFNLFRFITVTPALNLSSNMYTRTVNKIYSSEKKSPVTQTVKGYSGAFEYNFTTGLNTKVYFDYQFRSKALKQIRHLMIPTLTYEYRPDFGDDKYGYYKNVQKDSLGNITRYSIYEKSVFGGPQPGARNALALSIGNNLEAKIRQRSDSGFNYVKTTLIQDLSLSGNYNFAADSFNMSLINLSGRTKVFKYFDLVANSVFDPYAHNAENQRIHVYSYTYNGKLLVFQSAYFTVNAAFGSNSLEALKKVREAPQLTNAVEKGAPKGNEINVAKVNWNLRAYYNVSLSGQETGKTKPIQTFNFSGDISPTKYWKLGMTSGYDFHTKGLAYTSIDIYRDLKCWEMRINWVPFGFNKRYSIYLNLKASALSNIKIPRQKGWYDNIQ